MIRIEVEDQRVYIFGHAGYASPGSDIVCAGITALAETLQLSLERLTDDIITTDFDRGLMDIKFKGLSEAGMLLVDSFVIGAEDIASAYPHNVSVRDDRSRRETITNVK